MTRRLAAILAADVVGFSRLVSADEDGTLARLSDLRHAIIEPNIAVHAGRLFKTMGDGFLVEFASAVQAVTCAIAMQADTEKASTNLHPDEKMRLRVGVHVGDVIVEGDDLMGDGVNIAARLEGVADVGGVTISRAVHDQVRDRIDVTFEDKGEVVLKNITRPVQVFALVQTKAFVPAEKSYELSPALSLPDKPSIAVLPFQNMSGDPEQEYFADGMVEDIITALSRFKSLFVIARNSSFTYKGKAVDIKRVGRDLGVRYVLEGSVRKAGGKVRITGQLIEASTGAHLWADKFDGALEDVFELQDMVTANVVGAIAPVVEQGEIVRTSGKPSEHLGAYDCYYRAQHCLRAATLEQNIEALKHVKRAILLDSHFAGAYGLGASCYSQRKMGGWPISYEESEEGKRFAELAIEFGPDDANALVNAAHFFAFNLRDPKFSKPVLDQAISMNPNLFRARLLRGFSSLYLGDHEAAIFQFKHAIRLNPLDPQLFSAEGGIAIAKLFLGDLDEAEAWIGKSFARKQAPATICRFASVIYAWQGRIEDAKVMQERLRKNGSYMNLAEFDDFMPFQHPKDRATCLEGFRRAGVT